ncbi:nuclease-related domain-containing protein [Mycoplasma tauri]|uniref:nuclease-related domain-containing protein n=1 Tax=Mycoplasma tauri TaxID=547987 RepID=UPI001CC0E96D|nr:nuclease-related domain-containing protein [Mycoplasma tauri]MBZ4203637.1 NERD domain-containing protein [Mycoplasma tauri]MBZ4204282.1 NERD domain-containing protein [Mycoplasma tauri]MBZ4227011.1 NERD domain-containing protein [Mycoplasma tauri]
MYGLVIAIVFTTILLFFALFFYFWFYFKNKKRNTIGLKFEDQTKNQLITFAKNNNYKFLNGGLFKYSSNHFFEMDAILVGDKAVFIVEIKYLNGHIYGESFSDNLTLKNNRKEIKIKNPLIQNFRHIQHFYKMCNFNVPVFSLLIFPNETTYDISHQDSWSIITNVDKIDNILKEVDNDMADEANMSFEETKAVIDIVNLSRTKSIKDMKKFEKIINQNVK